MFQDWYASSYHHPFLFWLLQAISLLFIFAMRRKRLRALFLGLVLLSALDAWLSANHLSPLKNKNLATISAFVFVFLGDARFFVLLGLTDKLESKRILRGLALAMVVPVASSVAMITHPDSSRVLFLTYELMLFALAATIRFAWLPKNPTFHRPWQKTLCHFELVQYGLWASADIIILLGHDVGFLLRIVPNLLYYTAFVPVAYLSQPSDEEPMGNAA